tara:strand:- start:10928 stop:11128 length:201 start_codon:yes stop_codon:yes gene_type:complete
MDESIKLLRKKKREINQEISRVQAVKTPNPDYKTEFEAGIKADVSEMNERIKKLNMSIHILKEFNT